MGGMMSGGMGGKSGSGTTGMDTDMAKWALGQNEQAIHNRYQQLGIGTPAPGTNAQSAAIAGTDLTAGGPSTMEQMDIGTIPSETGGAIGQANALVGELFNPTNAAGLGTGGPIQSLQQLAGQQEQAGFAAGAGQSGAPKVG